MTHQSIEEIAGGLSEAQRAALVTAIDIEIGFITKIETGRSARALFANGLTNLSWAPSGLTPLGLAVRNHLLSKEGRG